MDYRPAVLVDSDALPTGTDVSADVVIVGAGPAGVTLARALDGSGLDVIVLEAGGAPGRPRGVNQERVVAGDTDFEAPRAFTPRFGGGANEWIVRLPWMRRGVRLVPLSPVDLEIRPWVPNSGWPLEWSELERYYHRAHDFLGLGSLRTDVGSWESVRGRRLELEPFGFTTSIEHFGHPTAFTRDAWQSLRRSRNVRIHLNASVGSLEGRGDLVEQIEIDNGVPARLTARAKLVILAASGYDNPRLLLASRRGEAYGNADDVVGRYFMDHLRTITGVLTPAAPEVLDRLALYDIGRGADSVVMGKIAPTASTVAEHGLLNSGAMLLPLPHVDDQQALGRAKRAVHDLAHRQLPRERPSGRDLVRSATFAAGTGARMVVKQRRFPPRTDAGWAQLGRNDRRYGSLTLEHQVEQAPEARNRIRLSSAVDHFGRPRAQLDWRWSEIDLASLSTTQRLLADAVQRAGVGTLQLAGWSGVPTLTTPGGAFHPMGATRMHPSPHKGVVDADGKVHGVQNLFVCGGSTFPTGGYANPTLTVVALALRLAATVVRELHASVGSPS